MSNAVQVKQLTAILTRIHDLLKTILQRYGKPSAPSVLREKWEKKDLKDFEMDRIDNELKQVWIVRGSGERYFTLKEAEQSIRSRK